MARDQSPVLPESVTVVFPTKRCTGNDSTPAEYAKVVTLEDLEFTIEGHKGTKVFHDLAPGLFNTGESTNPNNKTALDTLAKRIARDFYAWRELAFDRVYNGVVKFKQDGFADVVEWTYHLDRCETRVATGPYNDDPEELAHVGTDCCAGLDFYGPPISGSGASATISKYRLFLLNGKLTKCLVGTDKVCP